MCSNLEVLSIDVKAKLVLNVVADAAPKVETGVSHTGGKALTVVAYGPILGSMDSPKVRTHVSCTEKGFSLVATISRSEHYGGATAQNQLWRPMITVMVRLRSPEVGFESIWKMELTSGKEVKRARTPPYPEEKYPITVTKTLRAALADARTLRSQPRAAFAAGQSATVNVAFRNPLNAIINFAPIPYSGSFN